MFFQLILKVFIVKLQIVKKVLLIMALIIYRDNLMLLQKKEKLHIKAFGVLEHMVIVELSQKQIGI